MSKKYDEGKEKSFPPGLRDESKDISLIGVAETKGKKRRDWNTTEKLRFKNEYVANDICGEDQTESKTRCDVRTAESKLSTDELKGRRKSKGKSGNKSMRRRSSQRLRNGDGDEETTFRRSTGKNEERKVPSTNEKDKEHLQSGLTQLTSLYDPLTAQEIDAMLEGMKKHENITDKKGRRKVYIYVEDTTTGRFHRYKKVLEGPGSNTEDGASHAAKDDDASSTAEDCIRRIVRLASAALLSLKGVLAGHSIQALYESFLFRSPERFVELYSPRSNEVRRLYYLLATACFAGSICAASGAGGEVHSDPGARTRAHRCDGRWKIALSPRLITLSFYLVVLILTIAASVLDVQLAARAVGRGDGEIVWNGRIEADGKSDWGETLPNVLSWKAMSLSRSVCCVLAWVMECHGQYRDDGRRNGSADSADGVNADAGSSSTTERDNAQKLREKSRDSNEEVSRAADEVQLPATYVV